MHRAFPGIGAVDVKRIDPDEGHAGRDQFGGESRREIRVTFEILIGPPIRIPTGMKKHGLSAQISDHARLVDGALVARDSAHDHAIEVGQTLQLELGKIATIRITMEGAVDVGAGVGHHLNLPDLEFRARRVTGARGFPAEVIADDRGGQALVSDHPVLDAMAKVDQLARGFLNLERMRQLRGRRKRFCCITATFGAE